MEVCMSGKIRLIVSLMVFSLVFVTQTFSKQGKHTGEQKMLDVDIRFSGASGTTITNANGVDY